MPQKPRVAGKRTARAWCGTHGRIARTIMAYSGGAPSQPSNVALTISPGLACWDMWSVYSSSIHILARTSWTMAHARRTIPNRAA